MNQDERLTSGIASPAATPPGSAAVSTDRLASANGSISRDDSHLVAPAELRQKLLGPLGPEVLDSHKLPRVSPNGFSADSCRQLLGRIFGGEVEHLEPVAPMPVQFIDNALDASQREAIAKALATPDLCLIQGPPGRDKSRVIAEIVTQAAARGERVLLMARSTVAIDRVLERVGSRDSIYAVRCLGREENAARLPPALASLTLAARLQTLPQAARQAACDEVQKADQRCQRRRLSQPIYAALQEIADQRRRLEKQREAIRLQRDQSPAAVEQFAANAEAGMHPVADEPIMSELAAHVRKRRSALQRVDQSLAALGAKAGGHRQAVQELGEQITAMHPLASAKLKNRWWTSAWWRALFHGEVVSQQNTFESQRQTLQAELRELGAEEERLRRERQEIEEAYQVERQRLVRAELSRRNAELDTLDIALHVQVGRLDAEWQRLLAELDPVSPRPEAGTPEAVHAAAEASRQRLQQDQAELEFARQWAACPAQPAEFWVERLRHCANLVAGTTVSIAAGAEFGDAHKTTFDLLILDEAQQLTESEFIVAARRARRWVLLGEPAAQNETGKERQHKRGARRNGNDAPSRPRSHTLARSFFQRLWQHLHCDLWDRENGRLSCRLRPVAPEHRQWLESESLLDFPEIELRILARPKQQPVLSEIVFPAHMSLEKAKQFIYRELEEQPVRALPRNLGWTEESHRVVLRLNESPCSHSIGVVLEPGVREMGDNGKAGRNDAPAVFASACCLEFDISAGWDRTRAQEWVRQRLRVRDLGRTARLQQWSSKGPANVPSS